MSEQIIAVLRFNGAIVGKVTMERPEDGKDWIHILKTIEYPKTTEYEKLQLIYDLVFECHGERAYGEGLYAFWFDFAGVRT